MREGESLYVPGSRGIPGGDFAGRRNAGPYFIHGGAVVVCSVEKKSEGTVRENSLFG